MIDRRKLTERLLAHATMCQEAASLSWDEEVAVELEKLAEECFTAARELAETKEPDAAL